MGALSGPYIGFTYNNVHSSTLGIMRVSDGSRYNENLLPTMQDRTVLVPGGDGSYYFGSFYTQRQINVSFAFDGITEKQLGDMKQLFGDKKIHPLRFDEHPYKFYNAKVTGQTIIKYIPFAQGETGRVYKGEGEIQFICYQPYAICNEKNLASYENDSGSKEWKDAAKLVNTDDYNLDKLIVTGPSSKEGYILVYNPGVKEADWNLIMKFNGDGIFPNLTIKLEDNDLVFEGCSRKSEEEVALSFNSKTGLIEGLKNHNGTYLKTGNLYNEFLTSGDFFNIPTTEYATFKKVILISSIALDSVSDNKNFESFNYNYYYF